MNGSWLNRQRWRMGMGLAGLMAIWIFWCLAPGVPVLRGPQADAAVSQVGLELFRHDWRPYDPLAHGDGLGPVYNASSCLSCHFQGGVGGGGGVPESVFAFEALPIPGRPLVQAGLLHKYAVASRFNEQPQVLQTLFPIVPNGLELRGVCFSQRHDFNPVRTQRLNSIALFGAGWLDRISGRSIQSQQRQRSIAIIGKELTGEFGSIPPGRPRLLPDGRVGKFGWKAQFATLEEFVASACANEIGLGTPTLKQARPLTCNMTKGTVTAIDETEVAADLDPTQFQALVAFVATLPRPEEAQAADPNDRAEAGHGKQIFQSVGCALCHTPDLGGVSGIYSDLLLHRIVDSRKAYSEIPDVPPPPDLPLPEEWKTPPLWGVADQCALLPRRRLADDRSGDPPPRGRRRRSYRSVPAVDQR